MANPFAGIITADMKALFNNAISSLLESTALTVPCQFIFADTDFIECPNCFFDAMSGRSSNIYRPGGPIDFNYGNCPYCYGIGKITLDETLNTNLIVLWNYKDWIGWNGVPDNTMVPFGQCQTMSALSTLTDIKRAKEIILNTNLSTYVKHRFERSSEPNPIGLGDDAFVLCMWKRIAG